MDTNKLRKEFTEYAERMAEIKRLSTPNIRKMDSADDYSLRLQDNFKKIGQLASLNREMLDRDLYPLLNSESKLNEDLETELDNLADLLLNVGGEEDEFENVDLPITLCIRDRLIQEAENKDDTNLLIRRIDESIDACYSMMNMTERLSSNPKIGFKYKSQGIKLGKRIIEFLDKDTFSTITDDECKERVLSAARFTSAFYERSQNNLAENEENLELLDRIMEVIKDPYYKQVLPDYSWAYYEFRTYESYVLCTDINNIRGFNRDQLERICSKAEELDLLMKNDPEYYGSILGADFVPFHIARCRYLSGSLSIDEYKSLLLEAYKKRDISIFGINGGYMNILLPLEIICILDPGRLSCEDVFLVKNIYHNLGSYVFSSPTYGVLAFMQEYFAEFVNKFIEIPSCISLSDFILNSIAAIHPPTYVHSVMVGQISERLAYHLLRIEPERFIGMPGIKSRDDVLKHKDDILTYTYNAAICHDFGKIFIIDTIMVYGRKLLDMEFELIKAHPEMGYKILNANSSTRKYADVALFHHKWFDDSKGYPFDLKSADSPYKVIIDIVQCADCLDAATDTIGRSYNKGKGVAEYIEELKEGSGTRYAPWLYELFCHKEVYSDMEYLLDLGRKRNYRETYNLLRGVQESN